MVVRYSDDMVNIFFPKYIIEYFKLLEKDKNCFFLNIKYISYENLNIIQNKFGRLNVES